MLRISSNYKTLLTMYTFKVKVYFMKSTVSIDDFKSGAECTTIQLPTIPRIGEQIITPEILRLAKAEFDENLTNSSDDYDMSVEDFTYVNNIIYGDNVIYIALSFDPACCIAACYDKDSDFDGNTILYWTLVSSVPRIHDTIIYPTDYHHIQNKYRLVETVSYFSSSRHLLIRTYLDMGSSLPVYVENQVDANIVNTVDVQTSYYPISVKVDDREPIDVTVRDIRKTITARISDY